MTRNALRVLRLVAAPPTATRLAVDEEARAIKRALRESGLRSVDFENEWAVRPAELQRHLLARTYDIVHVSSHGAPTGELVLHGDHGEGLLVEQDALRDLFATFSETIQCVVLSACYSASLAEALSESIGFTIGMEGKVDDRASIDFAVSFYGALAHGRPVDESFDLACNQLALQGYRSWHGKPLLFTNPEASRARAEARVDTQIDRIQQALDRGDWDAAQGHCASAFNDEDLRDAAVPYCALVVLRGRSFNALRQGERRELETLLRRAAFAAEPDSLSLRLLKRLEVEYYAQHGLVSDLNPWQRALLDRASMDEMDETNV